MSEDSDYIFRYPVEKSTREGGHEPLVEMIRVQLESLLNLLAPLEKGEEVSVDGFRLMNEREADHPVFIRGEEKAEMVAEPSLASRSQSHSPSSFQSPRNAELYEPRIAHIKRVLESLLNVVDLESGGKPVKIDGFRLKDLRDWLVPSAGDPAEVFDHLATRCDCACEFCYIRGNPPSLALEQPGRPAAEEFGEAQTRLKYFSPPARRALFPTLGSPYEVLSHPRALDLLAGLRQKTDRPLRLSTNGNNLTVEFISRLAALKPVYLYLSLNSSSPERRLQVMGGRDPQTAISSLAMLKEMSIPYGVVVVPWPFPSIEAMTDDLSETIACADRHDAHLVEVSLPGYTRYVSESPLFDSEQVWSAVVSVIRSLRETIRTPLLTKPSLFEETMHEKKLNLPGVLGVVKNSPAASAGLKTGDLLLSIGGLKTSSRPQARDLLRLQSRSGKPAVSVSVRRGKATLDFELFLNRFSYPYSPETDHHLGIIFQGAGFRPSALEDLRSLIQARGANRVLLFSSTLVRPVFQQLLRESVLFGGIHIDIRVPRNLYFGGNICMGDLLVGRDFIAAIREYLKDHERPDLVVLPSSPFSLGPWKRDLEGRVYTEIERSAGVPVALLDCEPIYD